MTKRFCFQLFIVLLSIGMLGLTGCVKEGDNTAESEKTDGKTGQPQEASRPVTLTMYQEHGSFTDDEYQELIVDPVHKKYPNITVEVLRAEANKELEDYVAAGDFPDMILSSQQFIRRGNKLKLLADLRPLIQKHKMDVNRFLPEAMEEIKYFGKNGEIYEIPYIMQLSATFFNKDIFNSYGLDYPKDGMTWTDIINLSKKLGAISGGKVKSLNPTTINHFVTTLSLPYVDPKTGLPRLNTEQWQSALVRYKEIIDIPGNGDQKNSANAFFKDKNLAIMPKYSGQIATFEKMYKEGNQMNWDMSTYPQFEQVPGKGKSLEVQGFMISEPSKHKDEAFQVIQFLTDKSYMLSVSQNGRLPVVKDPDIERVFGQNLASLKGKNVGALFKLDPAPSGTLYDNTEIVQPIFTKAANNYFSGKDDVNTILRQAQDDAEKAVKDAMEAG
jgi:multiple sugar transport system substrate-binding protein